MIADGHSPERAGVMADCAGAQAVLFDADAYRRMESWLRLAGDCEVCQRCHRPRTAEGHDPCIANLPAVLFACCGHGVDEPWARLAVPGGPQDEHEAFQWRLSHAEPAAGELLSAERAYTFMRRHGDPPPPPWHPHLFGKAAPPG